MSKISDHDEFSTHAVPLAERVAAFRVAAVASMVSFSLPTFIAGIEVSAGVGSELSLPAILGGSAIIFLIGWLMGSVGARTGFNSYLLVRLAFGDTGARPSILLFLYRYWAGLESISIYWACHCGFVSCSYECPIWDNLNDYKSI